MHERITLEPGYHKKKVSRKELREMYNVDVDFLKKVLSLDTSDIAELLISDRTKKKRRAAKKTK